MPLSDSIFFSQVALSDVYGVLSETGICSDGNAIVGNETLILNQSAETFMKKLTMDNRLMAEMMCHAMLNEFTAKK